MTDLAEPVPGNQPPAKDPLAVELGRRGGRKGGRARAEKLTPEKRSDIARKAAVARWERSANDAVEAENALEGKRSRMHERLRQAFIAGAEGQSQESQGRRLTDEELDRVVKRYPGD